MGMDLCSSVQHVQPSGSDMRGSATFSLRKEGTGLPARVFALTMTPPWQWSRVSKKRWELQIINTKRFDKSDAIVSCSGQQDLHVLHKWMKIVPNGSTKTSLDKFSFVVVSSLQLGCEALFYLLVYENVWEAWCGKVLIESTWDSGLTWLASPTCRPWPRRKRLGGEEPSQLALLLTNTSAWSHLARAGLSCKQNQTHIGSAQNAHDWN